MFLGAFRIGERRHLIEIGIDELSAESLLETITRSRLKNRLSNLYHYATAILAVFGAAWLSYQAGFDVEATAVIWTVLAFVILLLLIWSHLMDHVTNAIVSYAIDKDDLPCIERVIEEVTSTEII
jgi:hypothetical protein